MNHDKHPAFCSEDCNVGINDVDARHRSWGTLATKGGLMGDKTLRATEQTFVDVVPAVQIEQHPLRGTIAVVLRTDVWITDRTGWVLPGEIGQQGHRVEMTPERADELSRILAEVAKQAREAQEAAS